MLSIDIVLYRLTVHTRWARSWRIWDRARSLCPPKIHRPLMLVLDLGEDPGSPFSKELVAYFDEPPCNSLSGGTRVPPRDDSLIVLAIMLGSD